MSTSDSTNWPAPTASPATANPTQVAPTPIPITSPTAAPTGTPAPTPVSTPAGAPPVPEGATEASEAPDLSKYTEALQRHGRRVWGWQVTSFEPDANEVESLGNEELADPTMQKYVLWRRSAMLVAVPLLIVGAVLAFISFKDIDGDMLNGFGVMLGGLQLLSLPILAGATIYAVMRWENVRDSQRALLFGWVAALLIPMVTAAIPAAWQLNKDMFTGEEISILSNVIAVANGLVVLPVLATFPAGVIRGTLRAKGIVPTATLPGWFLLAAAPLYGLVLLSALAMIGQVAGNVLLVFGVLLLAAAPWYFILHNEALVRPMLQPAQVTRLHRVQQVVSLTVLAGAAFITLWAFTSHVDVLGVKMKVVGTGDDAMLSPMRGALQLIDLVGRWMITTIVYTHVFLQATVKDWQHGEELRASDGYERHRRQLGWIDWVTSERAQPIQPVQIAPPAPEQ